MRRQDGLSLAEVLVAITVLALAMTTALVLYDQARKSFKLSENVIDEQQVVRIAFDLMAADLRMAGFNFNPDGDDDRPDEQFEGAFATAVVLRADLDAGSATAATPETDLAAAGIFDAVTTGNDEIVAYVLGHGASRDSLVYFADVAGQTRDGSVEQVTVPGVAMNQNRPPYVLYRVTLDVDARIVKTPLADNIRSLRFRYFDQAGTEIAPPGGADTPGAVRARASIRRVVLDIEGLTRDPDAGFIDFSDSNIATRNHRKFRLAGDVTPRNLGLKGLADLPGTLVLPAPPVTPIAVPGHCRGLYVKWSSPPPARWHYLVGWENADGQVGEVQAGGTGVYIGGLTHNRNHDVWIRGVDPFGNVSEPTDKARIKTSDLSPPREAANLTATAAEPGEIRLDWDEVTQNLNPIPGDPESPRLRDFRRYQVLRQRAGDLDWNTVGTTNARTYTDASVVACTEYRYRIRAEDLCSGYAPHTYEATGLSIAADAPLAPENLEAYRFGADVRVGWQPVSWNVAGVAIEVASYRVYRVIWTSGDAPPDLGLYTEIAEVQATDPLVHLDRNVAPPPGQAAFYRVVAVDGCGNESAPSEGVEPVNCQFTGTIVFERPTEGADTTGATSVRVDVQGGGENYESLRLEFTDLGTGATHPIIDCPTPSLCTVTFGPGWVGWSTTWVNGGSPHRITATVTTDLGCTMSRSILVGPGLGAENGD